MFPALLYGNAWRLLHVYIIQKIQKYNTLKSNDFQNVKFFSIITNGEIYFVQIMYIEIFQK